MMWLILATTTIHIELPDNVILNMVIAAWVVITIVAFIIRIKNMINPLS